MMYRKMSVLVGVLALGLYLTGSALQAQENRANQRTGGASAIAAQGKTWEGRISKLDSTKREITLSNVKQSQGLGGSKTGTSGTSGISGTSGTGARTGTDSGTADKAKDTMTFHVSATATITLDGKTATLSDLKSGQFARVSSRQSSTSGTGTSGTSGTSGTGGKTGTSGSSAAGKTQEVDKVEAFTKEPASTGGRSGTGAPPIK
jgi:hypothetical protein